MTDDERKIAKSALRQHTDTTERKLCEGVATDVSRDELIITLDRVLEIMKGLKERKILSLAPTGDTNMAEGGKSGSQMLVRFKKGENWDSEFGKV